MKHIKSTRKNLTACQQDVFAAGLLNKLEHCCYFIKLLQGLLSATLYSDLLRASDIKLVGTTCNKSNEVVDLVTRC